MILIMSDNLSAALQSSTVSASEVQGLMHMTLMILQKKIQQMTSLCCSGKLQKKKTARAGVHYQFQKLQRN